MGSLRKKCTVLIQDVVPAPCDPEAASSVFSGGVCPRLTVIEEAQSSSKGLISRSRWLEAAGGRAVLGGLWQAEPELTQGCVKPNVSCVAHAGVSSETGYLSG